MACIRDKYPGGKDCDLYFTIGGSVGRLKFIEKIPAPGSRIRHANPINTALTTPIGHMSVSRLRRLGFLCCDDITSLWPALDAPMIETVQATPVPTWAGAPAQAQKPQPN